MREIDLSKYQIRTDLVIDAAGNSKYEKKIDYDSCSVSTINLDVDTSKKINKKPGEYITLYFEDITDNTNFENVLKVLTNEINKVLKDTKIEDNFSCLIIGLGNEKSTPDALGVKVAKKCLVTRHIYDLTGTLEDGYRITSVFTPGVMGTTGIETSDLISSVIEVVNPNFIITIDALASDSIDRLLKTIQITNTGINPGSGIGNNRKEISSDIYNIPVIAIGVPTVVDATTIVSDTFKFLKKLFSYNIKNKDILRDRLIPSVHINYLKNNNYTLSKEETTYFLGAFGNLSPFEKKLLIKDVLTPIGYDLIVTPKEIDFVLERITNLISKAINNSLHEIYIDKKLLSFDI